jgi:hypothetical protein
MRSKLVSLFVYIILNLKFLSFSSVGYVLRTDIKHVTALPHLVVVAPVAIGCHNKNLPMEGV